MGVNKQNFKVAELLAAFFTGSQTESDKKELEQWVKEDKRNKYLSDRLLNKETYEENSRLQERFPADQAWVKIKPYLDNNVWRMKPWRSMLKYAAILLITVSVGVLYMWNRSRVAVLPAKEKLIPAGYAGARLTLGDGQVIDISKGNTFAMTEMDGTKIVTDSVGIDYSIAGAAHGATVWNTMQTFTGMEYSLTLSDGTKVFLNAETKLTFPVSFKGSERIVQLVGEAYFDVAKDAKHPFIVNTGGTAIKVLGTSFNLRAYDDEQHVVTTLLEGRVAVTAGAERREIVPGEQAMVSKKSGKMDVRKVDVTFYAAWRSGKFVFRNERLEDVLKALSRWYKCDYRFVDEKAKSIQIGASLDRYESMNPIIDILKSTGLVEVKFVDSIIYISSAK
jgi:transmembrane sensor